jgi:alpha-tubulin suppressor-like RCC1 family protein
MPFSATQMATMLTAFSGQLNGMAVPNGLPSVAWYQWGERGGFSEATQPMAVGASYAVVPVSATVTNLILWRVYQCRLVVSNSASVAYGATHLFTTGQRAFAWGDDYYRQSDVPLGLTNVVAVSAGWYHSLVLQIGGNLVGWGKLSPPTGLSNVVAIASGTYHSLALLSDGTVTAWGAGTFISDFDGVNYGQAIVPPAATGIVAIAAGGRHSLGLTATGTVIGWGDTNSGAANVPTDLSNVVAIAAGWQHSLALRADGTVAAWGANVQGETSVPQGLSNVVALAAGYWQSIALRNDGTVVTWGGSTSFPVPGLTNVLCIAQGADHHLALRQDGTVVAWGSQTNVPSTLTNASSISAGYSFSLAVVPNHAPVALDQAVPGPANSATLISLRAQDFERDNLAFHVFSLPSQGVLYQYSDAGRGDQIVNPGTLVTDPKGRVLFEPLPDGFGLPYSTFQFTANDGEIESSPATVSIYLGFPKSFSLPAAPEGSSAVSLKGFALPNGLPSEAWFEWSAIGSMLMPTIPLDIGRTTTPVYFSSSLQGLMPQLAYHARLVVSNAAGIAYGPFQLFTTGFRISAWGTNNANQISVPRGLTNIISLAAGARHSLCLSADSTVLAWGDNSSGQTNTPAGLTSVIAVAAGAAHSLALNSDGTLVGWGDNTQLQAALPSGLTNIVGIAAGGSNSIVLGRDGRVAEWGDNSFGQCQVPIGLSNVVAISMGAGHSAAVTIDRNLVAWGNNSYGQTNVPAGVTNVIAVAAGDNHMLALLANGAVMAWGNNDQGQCSIPIGLTNVTAIAAGGSHSIAVRDDGSVLAWGDNRSAQSSVPFGLTNVTAVAAGQFHSLALAPNVAPFVFSDSLLGPANRDVLVFLRAIDANNDLLSFRIAGLPLHGTLYQCLSGARGQPITVTDTLVTDPSSRVIFAPEMNGFGSPYDTFAFVANDGFIDSALAILTLVIGDFRAFTQSPTMLDPTSATLNGMGIPSGFPSIAWFEWGSDDFRSASSPFDLGSGMSVQRISARITNLVDGADYKCRLVVSNAAGITYGGVEPFSTGKYIEAWGVGTAGQTKVPIGIGKFTSVAAGFSHSVALGQNGTVSAWGSGTSQTNVPAGLSNVVNIAAGGQQTLALKRDGGVVTWGGSSRVPLTATNAVAVATGGTSSLVLRSDGTVVAWGQSGQVPVGLSNVVAIAAGAEHCLALKVDGAVVAWGLDTYGQTNTPADLRDVVAVAAGAFHSLALIRNGTVVGWGFNAQGQASPPPGLSNVIAISAGSAHSLALKSDGTVVAWGDPSQGRLAVPPLLTNVVAVAAGTAHTLTLGTFWRPAYAHTQFATRLRPTTAVLNGMSLAGGLAASAWFEWGSRGAYSQSSSATVVDESDTVVRISSPIGELQPGGVYQCRLVCSNAAGLTYGAPQIFTTGKKMTVWGPNALPQLVTNAVQVAGFTSEVAVDSGGRMTTWGSSQPPPDAVTNVVQAGVNTYGGFALLEDNTLRTWGTGMASSTSNIIAAAVAFEHGLALRSDGTVVAFGLPNALPPFVTAPQTNVPAGLLNVVQVAVGDFHSLALRSDGTVVAWGTDVYGPATKVPSGLSNIIAVAAGGSHSLALKSDGTVVAWGENNSGQGIVPSGVSNVVAISAGWLHNLVLKADGSAFAWGDPGNSVPAPANVATIASGALFSMAVADNLAPSVSAITVSGAVNHDLVVSLKGRDLNADPLIFRVESLPTQGSIYQYSAGVRGSAIDQTGVVIADSGHRIIFAPAAYQFGSPYTMFSYLASDSELVSPPALVSVNILQPRFMGYSLGQDASFRVQFSGASNATYSIWGTTNLADWTALGPAYATNGGLFFFADGLATNLPCRFYRVQTP